MAWSFELLAWFALVAGRYEEVIDHARTGLLLAPSTSAGVQLAVQEAKGWARLGNRAEAEQALPTDRGSVCICLGGCEKFYARELPHSGALTLTDPGQLGERPPTYPSSLGDSPYDHRRTQFHEVQETGGSVKVDIARLLLGAGGIVGVAGSIGRLLYKRFRRSGSREIESFRRYAIQGIKYYVGRYVRRQLAAELTLRQYARLHLRTTAKTMLVPATYPVQLNVDQVFVPLLLRGAGQDQLEYSQLLEQRAGRMLILGEPGSGKSSLLKRTFRDACRRAASSPRQAQLPVLFELRNLARQNEVINRETLMRALSAAVNQSAVYHAEQAVQHLGHGAGFLFLLDGLDEVPSLLASQVLDSLIDLSNHLNRTAAQSTLIVSSRTQHFLNLQRRDVQETFQVLSIRAFSAGDIYRFLMNWPFVSEAKAHVTRIFSRLRQLPSLQEMCTNPLALSMFVARDQQTGGGELPETRSRFYQAYIQELLVNRRLRREDLPAGRQRLQEVRQHLLGDICLGHLLSATEAPNSIPRERFVKAIADLNYGGGDASIVLPELSIDTGLFAQEREGETLRFLHLTLCEFFAASEVVERGDEGWNSLLPRVVSARPSNEPISWEVRLSEVVSFACGLAPRSLRQRILSDLANSAHRQLLLRAAVEGQAYDEPSVQRAIIAEQDELIAHDPTEWGVNWFARLRVMISVLRDAAAGTRQELSPLRTGLPTATTLLMQLINQYHAETQLLAALALQDADSAISIAEKTGRSDVFDLVTAAADDFAVLQGILARCESGNNTWKVALIYQALVNTSVANILQATLADKRNSGKIGRDLRGWHTCWITERSIYGQLLDEVLRSPTAWSNAATPLLTSLSRLTPPQSPLFATFAASLPSLILTIAGFAILTITPGLVGRLQVSFRGVIGLVGGAMGATFVSSLTYRLVKQLRTTHRLVIATEQEHFVFKADKGTIVMEVENNSTKSGRDTSLTWVVVPLRREAVLREILNLGAYRFQRLDDSMLDFAITKIENLGPELRGGDHKLPGLGYRLLRGVPRADLECLLLTRRFRYKSHKPNAGPERANKNAATESSFRNGESAEED